MTSIAARLHSAGRRELTVAVAAAVSTTAVWMAAPALVASQSEVAAFPASGFSNGMVIPVREIQRPVTHVVSLSSTPTRHRFARVACAGRARKTSECWIMRN